MIKKILILLLTLTFSCTEINRTENLLGKIEELRIENDSLKTIVEEINENLKSNLLAENNRYIYPQQTMPKPLATII